MRRGVYAEDPARDHRPSADRVTHVAFPDTVRVDTWLEAGTEVTPHYDPLLAKVIVHEADRERVRRNEDDQHIARFVRVEGWAQLDQLWFGVAPGAIVAARRVRSRDRSAAVR